MSNTRIILGGLSNTRIQLECACTILFMFGIYFREKRMVLKDTEHLKFHHGVLWFMRICIALAIFVFIESVIGLNFYY